MINERVEETYSAIAEVQKINSVSERKLRCIKDRKAKENILEHMLKSELIRISDENNQIEAQNDRLDTELKNLKESLRKLQCLLIYLDNYNMIGDMRLEVKGQIMGYIETQAEEGEPQFPTDCDEEWEPIN